MTGFGRENYIYNNKTVTIEIRTLNSKYFDLNLKLPSFIREKETEIRNILSTELERGKIEVYVSFETGQASSTIINETVFESHYKELLTLSEKMNKTVEPDIFSLVMRLPDIYNKEQENIKDEEWQSFELSLIKSCEKVNEFRLSEGAILKQKIEANILNIRNLLEAITPFEESRITSIRERILKNIDNYFNESNSDKNRFEQEIIYYIEKLDITEEKVRLLKHLNFFAESINESKSNGKKLGFVAQEIGREINTIGSKANHFEIQQIVVNMKDELEQIKEQLGNIL